MSPRTRFYNPNGAYFVTFAVVEWLDVFTRQTYRDIVVDSFRFCQENKGMEIFSWVIMSNHLHFVFQSVGNRSPQQLLGDFKRFTSKAIVKAIQENPKESRRNWLMDRFSHWGQKTSNVNQYQFWRHDNHPVEIWSSKFIHQKINYIHMNPVNAGIVAKPEQYVYSSARDYCGEQGILEGVVVWK